MSVGIRTEDGGLAGVVETDYDDAELLAADQAPEQLRENKSHILLNT